MAKVRQALHRIGIHWWEFAGWRAGAGYAECCRVCGVSREHLHGAPKGV